MGIAETNVYNLRLFIGDKIIGEISTSSDGEIKEKGYIQKFGCSVFSSLKLLRY